MASLAQTVSQAGDQSQLIRGPDGVLEQKTDDLQALAAKRGMTAPPTTPAGAALIGANPDQAKMAGSPAQMQNALALSSAPPATQLQQAEREQGPQASASAQAQAASEKAKSAQLEPLGALGARVQQMVDSRTPTGGAGNTAVGDAATIAASGVAGLPTDPTQLSALQAALQTQSASPGDQQSLATINRILGRDPTTQVSSAELSSLYQSASAQLSSGAEQQMTAGGGPTVGSLISQLGTDLPTLSGLLGVDQNTLAGYSVPQLQQAVAAVHAREFGTAAKTQQMANSDLYGGAVQAEAAKAGQTQASTGLQATEAGVQKLNDSVQRGDQVSFDGKQYGVEDLLSSGTISGVVSDYLQAADGSPERKQLEASEPGLVSWINSNKAALQQASAEMSGGVAKFADTQKFNAAQATFGSTQLSDAAMKALVPGFGELSADRIDPSKVGILQARDSMSAADQQALGDSINTIVATNPDAASELSGLSAAQAQQLAKPGMAAKYTADMQAYKTMQAIDPRNADSVLQAATGQQGLTAAAIQPALQQNAALHALGLQVPANPLDPSYSGTFNAAAAASLAASLQGQAPKPSLSAVLGGTDTTWKPLAAPTPYQPASNDPTVQLLTSTPAGAALQAEVLAHNGKLTAGDIIAAHIPAASLGDLLTSPIASKWGGGAIGELSNEFNAADMASLQKNFANIYQSGDPAVQMLSSGTTPTTQGMSGILTGYMQEPAQQGLNDTQTTISNLTSLLGSLKSYQNSRTGGSSTGDSTLADRVAAVSSALQSAKDTQKTLASAVAAGNAQLPVIPPPGAPGYNPLANATDLAKQFAVNPVLMNANLAKQAYRNITGGADPTGGNVVGDVGHAISSAFGS